MIVQCRQQRVDAIAQVLGQKQSLLLIVEVHITHFDTLLLSAPVIVLGLHLHELQPTDAVGAKTDLLAVGVPTLVLVIHSEVAGVEIGRIIRQITTAIDVLHEIVLLGHLQQLTELIEVGDELRIRTVHQFHTAHLLQGNGGKGF